MLRAVLSLVVLCSAAQAKDTANCALNGARAVDDMLDSAVYILASVVRCDGTDTIRCVLDVSSAIESVNAMVNVILKAVESCGGLETNHQKCGLAIGVLTKSVAGLSAASAGIIAKCPNKLNHGHPLDTVAQHMESASRYGGRQSYKTAGFSPGFGQCMVNIKDSVKSLFKAIKRVMTIKDNCNHPDSKHCMHNSAKIVAAFTGVAEYISGAVGKCSGGNSSQQLKLNALCAQMSIRLFHELDNVDRAGVAMARACHITEAERLYLDNENVASATPGSSSSVTIALAALLPITAVLSFLGGKRLAKSNAQPAADCEMLVEEE